MTDYSKTVNFAAKDALISGNPNKVVQGTEIDTEFDNIATAIATKADKASPTFTGTAYTELLVSTVDDSSNNSTTSVHQLTHTTSGTPANGIGVSTDYIVETTAGNNETGMVLGTVVADVTSTSEDFDFVVKLMAAGATAAEAFRVSSTGVATVTSLVSGTLTATSGSITDSSGAITFGDENLSTTGNLAIGTTLEAWDASWSALQVGGNAALLTQTAAGDTNTFFSLENAYYNGVAFKAISTSPASYYSQYQGTHSFASAPSVTAGADLTFSNTLTVDINGNTVLSGTLASGALSVNGTYSANAVADDVVIGAGTSNRGITIASANTSKGYLMFADSDANNSGQFYYDHSDDSYHFLNAASETMVLETTGLTVTGQTFVTNTAGTNVVNWQGSAGKQWALGTLAGYSYIRNVTDGVDPLYITDAGEVQLQYGLTVTGPATLNVSTNQGLVVNDGTVNGLVYCSSGPAMSIGTTTNHAVNILSNNATVASFSSTGLTVTGNQTITSSETTGVAMTLGASSLTSGQALYIPITGASFSGNCIYAVVGNAAATGRAATFQNEGTGNGVFIDQNGNGVAALIDSEATSVGALDVYAPTTAYIQTLTNQHASGPFGLQIDYSAASPDSASSAFLFCQDSTTSRLIIQSDGDVLNHDGTYGTISDARLKTDFAPARSYWDDFKALKYQTYLMNTDIDQYGEDATRRLGLVAQEVEEVFPALVKHGETDEDMKAVKSSIIDGVINSIVLQEAMDRIEQLEGMLKDKAK